MTPIPIKKVPSIMTNQAMHNILCLSSLMRFVLFLVTRNLVTNHNGKLQKILTTYRQLIGYAIQKKEPE